MKRRMASLLLLGASLLTLSSCGSKDTLLFLNWGEYIDESLIESFEEEYNCTVQMDLGESNEIFYSKAKAGTTVYDVICPSDYMVEKMYVNDLLEKLDFSQLPNVDLADRKLSTKKIYEDMNINLKQNLGDSYEMGTIENYAVPYLSGTWCIMYTTKKDGVEQAVTNNAKNQWGSLFDRSTLPAGTKVAMYESHQHDYYALSRYLGLDPTLEQPQTVLDQMEKIISNMNYDAWGTDTIKKDIVAGNIHLGYMWTGDFLYYYSENAANQAMDAYLAGDIKIDEVANFLDVITSDERKYTVNDNTYEIGFDCFIPDDTVAFCDNLVITKDSANKELAYKFIDYMLTSKVEDEEESSPAFTNTYYVDYDAPYNTVYNDLVALADTEIFNQEVADEFDPKDGDPYDSDLYWLFYDYAIGLSFAKYYENDEYLEANNLEPKGNILALFDRKYVNRINVTFNNARV